MKYTLIAAIVLVVISVTFSKSLYAQSVETGDTSSQTTVVNDVNNTNVDLDCDCTPTPTPEQPRETPTLTPTPTPTVTQTPTPTPTNTPSNPGGPGDGRSDGRSDGKSDGRSDGRGGAVLGLSTTSSNGGAKQAFLLLPSFIFATVGFLLFKKNA